MITNCLFQISNPLLITSTNHQFHNKFPHSPIKNIITRASSSVVVVHALVDPWAPTMAIDTQNIASQLFAFSLFPYIGFLYFITKSKTTPKLTLFGFYFLLAFVAATIPAGIYAKVHYGTSLSNVDWLHGGAESLLTLTNLLIVIGLRQALKKVKDEDINIANALLDVKDEMNS